MALVGTWLCRHKADDTGASGRGGDQGRTSCPGQDSPAEGKTRARSQRVAWQNHWKNRRHNKARHPTTLQGFRKQNIQMKRAASLFNQA